MTYKLTKEQKQDIRQALYIQLARLNFWVFCKLMDPLFFKEERKYQKRLAYKLQEFYENKNKKFLLINMPPRFGKSYMMQMFQLWILGINRKEKLMTASYNETLAINFSKQVRNKIDEIKVDKDVIVYHDIFPDSKVKHGNAAAKLWSLEKQFASYLSTSPSGTATGFGCTLLVIDDLIKNSYEAHNARILEEHWAWFTGTMRSRVEKGGKIVIIATRWCNDDLSGHILQEYDDVEVITEAALKDEKTHEMLCEEILSYDDYMSILEGAADKNIIIANYQQITFDEVDRVYTAFKEYEEKEKDGLYEIYSYCDTADQGADFLCNIIFAVDRVKKRLLILDIYYTQEPMEVTEKETANRLNKHNVINAVIESNNGGRGFARSVERILREELKSYKTTIQTFTQTKNKLARITTNASAVMQFVYFPANWNILFPQFYRDIFKIQRSGKALHDDSADALTGIVEISENMGLIR